MSSLGSSPLNLTITSEESSTGIGQYTHTVNGDSLGVYIKSLFNDSTAFAPVPFGEASPDQEIKTTDVIHTNDYYDTSLRSIIDYTSNISSMKLTPADFAYLKDVGTLPNNRLIVARRFPSGVQDDLTAIKNSKPISTIISYIKEGDDPLKFSFGEEWTDSESSFVSLLNDIGGDVMLNGLGDSAAKGFGVVPLPGMMEGLQYSVFKRMGITDVDAANLPFGNPNLIREAKQRKVLRNEPGSGLKADFSIDIETTYEQKYISGIDPTLVFYDIISNILSFGTSNAEFQFNAAFKSGVTDFVKGLTSGTAAGLKKSMVLFITTLMDSIKEIGEEIVIRITSGVKAAIEDPSNFLKMVVGQVADGGAKMVQSIINKYRVRIMGITNALTGGPSTPWHVTIGNPKKPLFTSGDMLVEKVEISLGQKMAFNDLPSTITAKFTMTNARSWGAQEIFRKMNTGRGRSYKRIGNMQSFVDTPQTVSDEEYKQAKDQIKANVEGTSVENVTKQRKEGDQAYAASVTKIRNLYQSRNPLADVLAQEEMLSYNTNPNIKKTKLIDQKTIDSIKNNQSSQ